MLSPSTYELLSCDAWDTATVIPPILYATCTAEDSCSTEDALCNFFSDVSLSYETDKSSEAAKAIE